VVLAVDAVIAQAKATAVEFVHHGGLAVLGAHEVP
jgi:hypothetical protein